MVRLKTAHVNPRLSMFSTRFSPWPCMLRMVSRHVQFTLFAHFSLGELQRRASWNEGRPLRQGPRDRCPPSRSHSSLPLALVDNLSFLYLVSQ
jgi:hypothetical protein